MEVSVARRWYKGNLHTHTSNSDGDAPPEEVVRWYRDAGYDFLALTDHDWLTLPDDHRAVAGPMELIAGEEVTAGDIHINGLGVRQRVAPAFAPTERQTLEQNAANIRAVGGLPSINHPNFRWALRGTDIATLGNVSLFELYNAAPETNGAGGRTGHPPVEALWDHLLTSGKPMVAIAVDDAHHFRVWGHRYSNPGRAWVHVRAESATSSSILSALEAGDCYASSGVELEHVAMDRDEVALDIGAVFDRHYRTAFIGHGGRVLDVVDGVEPRYRYRGDEGYVRARVDDSDGHKAWTQARMLG